jgi:aminomethyltransferase
VDEHLAVRTRAGLFDVSHMGEIELAGTGALDALQRLTPNDVARLRIGQAHYSALTTPAGAFVDDLLVYRMADDHFLLVVNASNIQKDYRWIADHVDPDADVAVVNSSARYALLALQGPLAREILQPLTGADLSALKYYWFTSGEVASVLATITGYPARMASVFRAAATAGRVWNAILAAAGAGGACQRASARTLRLGAPRLQQ